MAPVRLDNNLHPTVLRIVTQRSNTSRGVSNVLLAITSGTAVHTNSITTELLGTVDPAFVLIHRAFAGGGIAGVELMPRVDENQHVFHALAGGALGEFADIFFVRMLAAEGAVPIFDVRDAQLLLGERGVIKMIQLAGNPAVKSVFLNADLETVRIILVLGQQCGDKTQSRQAEGGLPNK